MPFLDILEAFACMNVCQNHLNIPPLCSLQNSCNRNERSICRNSNSAESPTNRRYPPLLRFRNTLKDLMLLKDSERFDASVSKEPTGQEFSSLLPSPQERNARREFI